MAGNPEIIAGKAGPGRPKGIPNKSTERIRQAVASLVEDNLDQLRADLAALKPRDRVRCVIDLMAFTLPKMRELSGGLRISEMDDQDIEELIDRLTNAG
jgi:hypothetical protein